MLLHNCIGQLFVFYGLRGHLALGAMYFVESRTYSCVLEDRDKWYRLQQFGLLLCCTATEYCDIAFPTSHKTTSYVNGLLTEYPTAVGRWYCLCIPSVRNNRSRQEPHLIPAYTLYRCLHCMKVNKIALDGLSTVCCTSQSSLWTLFIVMRSFQDSNKQQNTVAKKLGQHNVLNCSNFEK